MSSFAVAVVMGIVAGIAPGPVLALVLATSLRHGFGAGARVALAPVLADLPVVVIVFGIMSRIPSGSQIVGALALVGAGYLAWLGVREFRRAGENFATDAKRHVKILEVAALNFVNPHVWLFWLGVGGPIVLRESLQGWWRGAVFVVVFYAFLTGAKLVIAGLTARGRRVIGERQHRLILRATAIVLVIFAIGIAHDGLELLRS